MSETACQVVHGESSRWCGCLGRWNQSRKPEAAGTRAVRQLEDELGVVLINRSTRQITLTTAGELLRSKLTQLVEDMTAKAALVREHNLTKMALLNATQTAMKQ